MRERMATRAPQWLAILLVSLAGLLLEVGYTRIVSYKLWYYYTYLVIGLSLLGIGSGGDARGRLGAAAPRDHRADHRPVLALGRGEHRRRATWWSPASRSTPWPSGTTAAGRRSRTSASCGLICFALFATFIALGIIVATLLGRAGSDGVGRLYFADLLGAGLGCLLAIPLIVQPRSAHGGHAGGPDLRRGRA